jgi:hypothetical protein
MDLSRLRRGELIAAAGGIVLLIALLFLDWYSAGVEFNTPTGAEDIVGKFGAWDAQGFTGTIADLIILAAGISALGLAVLTATSRTVALPVAASALTAGLGIAAVVMVFLRMVFQPGPNELIDLQAGIFVALIGAAVVAYGGWESMKEEGTTFDEARRQLSTRYADSRRGDAGASRPAGRPYTDQVDETPRDGETEPPHH